MKLFDRYNRITLISTVMVMIITGVVYYLTISYILTDQVDKDLVVEENEIFDYVKLNHHLPQVFKSEDQQIYFKPAGKNNIARRFTDTLFWNDKEQERESGRGLISSVKVNNANFQITVIESKVKTEDLIRVIFLITLGIIIILILVLIVINRVVIRNLWQPFYAMLQQVKLFNLTDRNSITGLDTRIEEFKDMNHEITSMSMRVKKDYQELRSFTENAAHELMTPIAVMNSKLDTLVQGSALTDRQGELIAEVYASVSKMRRLNKSMLLLARLENRLIQEPEVLQLKEKVTAALTDFQELLAAKDIRLHSHLQDEQLTINRDLLDILLNNLLSNAIRHNYRGGEIFVSLNNCALIISNTGNLTALNSELIFRRFQKSADSEGTGLGLTLAREICESYGFTLHYGYLNNLHCFTVKFC